MLSSTDATPPPSGSVKIHLQLSLEQRLHTLEHENEYLRSELIQTRTELLRVTRRKQALEVAAREQRERINILADNKGVVNDHEDASVKLADAKAKIYQQFTHKFILDTESYKNTILTTQADSYETMADALITSMNELFSTKETIYKAELDRLRKINKELEIKCMRLRDKLDRMKMYQEKNKAS